MTHHNYCSNCGTPLEVSHRFCPNCGAKIGDESTTSTQSSGIPNEPNTAGAFPRMLAYIPGLFWVPLAVDSKDPDNRGCANQGLLLLLYCIIVPFLFGIVGAIFTHVFAASIADTVVYPVVPQYPYTYPTPDLYGGFRNFGEYFDNFGRYFENFGAQFSGLSTQLQSLEHSVFSGTIIRMLLSLLCAPFFLYVPINSIWGFIHCINHREPHVLPVIGKIKIIK